jgi:hypothetical protein
VLLAGDVLGLDGAGVAEVVRVVDLDARLPVLLAVRHEVEPERAVRQLAEAVVEVLVDRPDVTVAWRGATQAWTSRKSAFRRTRMRGWSSMAPNIAVKPCLGMIWKRWST